MDVADLTSAMDAVAPPGLAEAWDNVGLIVGDPAAGLSGVLLCIDLTEAVVEEARRLGATAVVAYHPPIFKGVKRITPGGETTAVWRCVRHGIAVHSPHTALDAADGGTCDVLADAMYLTDRRPLRPRAAGEDSHAKLVTFVPRESVEAVADALAVAGCGAIGDYSRCTFQQDGTGTFLPGDGASPAVGTVGELERVAEVRLETVVPRDRLPEVVAALRSSHPYEEPAFDVLPRLSPAGVNVGMGRIGRFEDPVPRDVLIGRVRRELGVSHVLAAGPVDGEVTQVACCPGSCGDLLDEAARQGAGFYLTGELRHHDALRAARLGITACCVLHSNSERATLDRLRRRLEEALPGVAVAVSEVDCDPFRIL